MTFPLVEVQTAVYGVLNDDVSESGADTLGGLGVTGVFDHVPEGTVYPYVELGETTATPENAHDRTGKDQVLTLHVWSEHHGYSEALNIAARIATLLDHQALTLDNDHHVYTHFEFAQTLRDPNPDLRHVPVRFRVVTEESP